MFAIEQLNLEPRGWIEQGWAILENPRHLVIFILWGIGSFAKQTHKIENDWIPWILLAVGPFLSLALTLAQTDLHELIVPSPWRGVQIGIVAGIWGLAYAIISVVGYDWIRAKIEKRRLKKQQEKADEDS